MRNIIKAIAIIIIMNIFAPVYASDMCKTGMNNDWSKGNYRVVVVVDNTDEPYQAQMRRTVTYSTGTFTTVIKVTNMPFANVAEQICEATQAY